MTLLLRLDNYLVRCILFDEIRETRMEQEAYQRDAQMMACIPSLPGSLVVAATPALEDSVLLGVRAGLPVLVCEKITTGASVRGSRT